MSIKDLFDKGHSLKFVKNKTKDDLVESVESVRHITSYSEKRERFVPDVNFATASNFARFGLAEEYYDTAIKRIYQSYPYDGSQAEKIEWENESTYLDLFLFENEYPRTNGLVSMGHTSSFGTNTPAWPTIFVSSNPQYIFIKGGPNSDPNGDYKSEFSAGSSKKGISKANIYHTASQRTNNLELDLEKGVTVEFWLKKDGWATGSIQLEHYFHLWNSGSVLNAAEKNVSLRINSYGAGAAAAKKTIFVNLVSGSTSIDINHDTGLTDIADSTWRHYAVTLKTSSEKTVSNLYVDGVHQSQQTNSNTIGAVDGSMIASIGSMVGPLTGSTTIGRGWGNIVSASFDEFRYWKTERDAQQIGRFYRDQIGGGTNTDNVKYDDISNKVDLGVYYKFNEGITGISSTDSTILDYSGRISNGEFFNYDSTCRSTESAIVLSKAATKEFKDPILYSSHPLVSSLSTAKRSSGSMHDHENTVSLYKSLPGWILEEDEEQSNNIKYLTQVMASFFDDLYLQIEKLPRLKDINYPYDNNYEKPLPFADRLLSSRGYDAPELFADASELAKYLERDEKILFEKKLYEVKNTIYQNIYNNLSYIQKSKGTFKSLRNFLRCFGVDEELIKLNIYSNNETFEFKDNQTYTAVRKKYIDFDDAETRYSASGGDYAGSFEGTAYQYYDSSDSNSLSYIPAIAENMLTGAMMTIETEVMFPKRNISGDKAFKLFPGNVSSIFGIHAVKADNEDLSFEGDTVNFNITANRSDNDLRNVKFGIKTDGSSVFSDLENDSAYAGVYDNEKWNLAFRLRPTKANIDNTPVLNTSVGFLEPAASAYTYELYGVNYLSNILQNEFILSGTMSLANATTFFTKPKRLFVGADRTNYTGSVIRPSDVKVSSTRVWMDYLPDAAVRAHARDPKSYGSLEPYRNTNDSLNDNFVPQIASLILNWSMDNITGSNSSGQFFIPDFASGSSDYKLKFGDKWSKPISKYNYSGRGDKFSTNTNLADQAVDVEFVQSAKFKLPEVVNSDDMVKILNKQDDVVFTRDTTYIQHLLSVEKSMYQTISEEMLRFFATVTNFNNLVGEPVNRYRPYYKKMAKLRELFFTSVENDRLDLEKFIEYFKWVDDAVTMMIAQLIPVSSNSTEFLRNMVESHVLERNKYWTKFPTLEVKPREPISSLKAIEELKYNWKFGHAPLNPDQNTNQDENCLWWKQRAERDGVLSSPDASVNSEKNTILKLQVTEVSGAGPTLKTVAGSRYVGTYYNNRSLARPIDLLTKRMLSLKGGGNPKNNLRHDFYKNIIKWGSDDDFIYLDLDNETGQVKCNDQYIPPEIEKKQVNFRALVNTAAETLDSDAYGTGKKDKQYTDAKSTLLVPFSVYTSSVDTGYQSLYANQFKVDFTNLHEDKYGIDAEIPMQSPFTEQYVGGMQHRHVKLNRGSDSPSTRPEGWFLQEFVDLTSKEYILDESFDNAPEIDPTTDPKLVTGLPVGSAVGDPSPYEYWRSGVNADNPWSFIKGNTPTIDTGPSGSYERFSGFAYCEVAPSQTSQSFGLVTPLIDLLDVASGSFVAFEFKYHMHGSGIGNLKVQASTDPDFETGVQDLAIRWETLDTGGGFHGPESESTVISGQQHSATSDDWSQGRVTSIRHVTIGDEVYDYYSDSLKDFLGKRFYIRFMYTAGLTHQADCAIDYVRMYKGNSADFPAYQNSFKLLSPTHDNHNLPKAIYTRDTVAKRPVNIRNIHMTGNSPTVAGNYLDRYEFINTTSPEANDPWFVKNVSKITRNTAEILGIGTGSIQEILTIPPGTVRADLQRVDYELPDRTYLTGTIRNRTRFKTRFSSPGGFEVSSRGFLDPAHEIYSVYNAMPWRNNWGRKVYNSQLQAHQGRFGVSTHGPSSTSARVYGSEVVGTIRSEDYTISGDAAVHKRHRNNLERYGYTGDRPDAPSAAKASASVTIANYASLDTDDKLFLTDVGGTVHEFRVGVDFAATTSDEVTAASLNTGINASGKFSSSVSGDKVTITQLLVGKSGNTAITFAGDGFASGYWSKENFTGGADGPGIFVESTFDNAFVSHMIPRSDKQTRWITGSII